MSDVLAFYLGGCFVLFHVRWKAGVAFSVPAVAVALTWPFWVLRDFVIAAGRR
jgi:hypothetical protein